MKTITKTFNIYRYEELSETAKGKVKEWYLNDWTRSNIFYDDCIEYLKYLFPHSDLDITFSLSYCEGDGFNTYGTILFDDFINIDNIPGYKVFKDYTEKEIKRLKYYFRYYDSYTFEKNNHYSYSCKFIDIKYRQNDIDAFIEELEFQRLRDIDRDLIERFICDMLDFFEEYDAEQEKSGYNYFYEISDEDLRDFCEANDYYFTEEGEIY